MDKVVIGLYKKKLYTNEAFRTFVRVKWITIEQFEQTTGVKYLPESK
ncbi:MAG: XkdX family protein [Staphylococcus warneri]|nr:XkdX family protein [Staphylococcus warneri]